MLPDMDKEIEGYSGQRHGTEYGVFLMDIHKKYGAPISSRIAASQSGVSHVAILKKMKKRGTILTTSVRRRMNFLGRIRGALRLANQAPCPFCLQETAWTLSLINGKVEYKCKRCKHEFYEHEIHWLERKEEE